MLKKFKRNQPIIATLPSGRVVEGLYVEPWSDIGHTISVNEYDGERGGKAVFKIVNYGVKDDFINALDTKQPSTPYNQYKAWLKRAITLEDRIKEYKDSIKLSKPGSTDEEKLKKKIMRSQYKLDMINEKIEEYENED